jgi:hypothetical protein
MMMGMMGGPRRIRRFGMMGGGMMRRGAFGWRGGPMGGAMWGMGMMFGPNAQPLAMRRGMWPRYAGFGPGVMRGAARRPMGMGMGMRGRPGQPGRGRAGFVGGQFGATRMFGGPGRLAAGVAGRSGEPW